MRHCAELLKWGLEVYPQNASAWKLIQRRFCGRDGSGGCLHLNGFHLCGNPVKLPHRERVTKNQRVCVKVYAVLSDIGSRLVLVLSEVSYSRALLPQRVQDLAYQSVEKRCFGQNPP